jgi:hypothetical protein
VQQRSLLPFRFEGEPSIPWCQVLSPQFDGPSQHVLEFVVRQTHHRPGRVADAVHTLPQSSQQVCAGHSSEARARADYPAVTAPIERDVVQVRDVAGE